MTSILWLYAMGGLFKGAMRMLEKGHVMTSRLVEIVKDEQNPNRPDKRRVVHIEMRLTPEEEHEVKNHPTVKRGMDSAGTLRDMGELQSVA